MIHMFPNLVALRQRQQRIDDLDLPHVLDLRGLCPLDLGYDRFRAAYHLVRTACQTCAPDSYVMAATYADHTRVGYTVRLPSAAAKLTIKLAFERAMRRPCSRPFAGGDA